MPQAPMIEETGASPAQKTIVRRHVLWTGFLNGASTLKQYFVLPLNGLEYYLMYTFKVVHVLWILDPGTYLHLTPLEQLIDDTQHTNSHTTRLLDTSSQPAHVMLPVDHLPYCGRQTCTVLYFTTTFLAILVQTVVADIVFVYAPVRKCRKV